MDEPLALIKKPRKDPESTEEKTKSSATTQIQVMCPPHVILSQIISVWAAVTYEQCQDCMSLCSLSVAAGYHSSQWYISHL